jgi:hypothetical protein
LAAAVLSGLTLWASGKREERRWQKDARVSTYQRFIEVSFERSFKTVLGIRNRQGVKTEDLDKLGQEELRQGEWELHLEYDSLLTRIRLVSDDDVVRASEALHDSDQKLVELSLRSDAPATDFDWNVFEEERERNRQAKEAMLNAARATLGFAQTARIGDAFWQPSAERSDQ